MFDYGEACPISKAASVLCERWTLQIIREMLLGASRFSEFQKFLPRMSPTLLNSRLRSLESAGIIMRHRVPEKKGYEYVLTPSGRSLQPVLSEMGKWGMAWVFDCMSEDQMNVSTIIRDFAVAMDTTQLPSGDCTIQFNVEVDSGTVKKFVLIREGRTQVCEDNIGYEVDVYLSADVQTLYELWYGDISHGAAREQGRLKVVAAPVYCRNLSNWLRTSQFSTCQRMAGHASSSSRDQSEG